MVLVWASIWFLAILCGIPMVLPINTTKTKPKPQQNPKNGPGPSLIVTEFVIPQTPIALRKPTKKTPGNPSSHGKYPKQPSQTSRSSQAIGWRENQQEDPIFLLGYCFKRRTIFPVNLFPKSIHWIPHTHTHETCCCWHTMTSMWRHWNADDWSPVESFP